MPCNADSGTAAGQDLARIRWRLALAAGRYRCKRVGVPVPACGVSITRGEVIAHQAIFGFRYGTFE